MSWIGGAFFGPLVALILFGVIAVAIKLLIAKMPDCWLREQLLRERIKGRYSASNRRILEKCVRSPRDNSQFK